jgi:tetratricopeptide (TPR) repeat protein
MRQIRAISFLTGAALAATSLAFAGEAKGRKFESGTKSEEARKLLTELQTRIENFQFGPQNAELAKKVAAADPNWALGQYYVSATAGNPADGEKEYLKAKEMAAKAPEGERRFIEALYWARVNQGTDFKKSIEPLDALSKDYSGERLVFMLLGQLYQGDSQPAKARAAFEKAQAIGPRSARAEAFLAGDELLKGNYEKARGIYEGVEKNLPKGSVPFAIRFGVTFSHLYQGHTDAALASLKTYLDEYKANGLDAQFPEVFIWNAMARINLEAGRLEEAMADYKKGYESVPGSKLPEDQKQTWYGRLRHGTARTLARMGKHQEAWAETEAVKKMIEDGGEAGKQYWPAYHYLAGYVKLEAGDFAAAVEHLKQADGNDPFHTLLLARSYEKLGQKAEAKKTYEKVVASQQGGIERALSYPEAKRKAQSL